MDGENAKTVREQVFLSKYRSEPGILESSICKSPAYYQYCHSDVSVANGGKSNNDKKHCPWSVAKNWKYSNSSKKIYDNSSVFLSVFECQPVWMPKVSPLTLCTQCTCKCTWPKSAQSECSTMTTQSSAPGTGPCPVMPESSGRSGTWKEKERKKLKGAADHLVVICTGDRLRQDGYAKQCMLM